MTPCNLCRLFYGDDEGCDEGKPVCSPHRDFVGGTFEDETGWWQVDAVTSEGTAWLVGRGGVEREIALKDLPTLTYPDGRRVGSTWANRKHRVSLTH